MLPTSSLADEVRRALTEAGFQLITDTDGGTPGLQVSEIPEGVLIRWVSSDQFQAPACEQPGRIQGDGMRAMVQAAVLGLLMQQGHMITEVEEDDLLVLPPAAPFGGMVRGQGR
ncbi:hypothetical protein [Streptomyces sp. SLBN-115]|uniref:hypothetical protein n=1 Tax=Streptomyces sp. SLBN-115 TaxID=2768453 RepID=UPI00114D8465|nr:hypothetical protein [Streptomyces sp. SLBN-115]